MSTIKRFAAEHPALVYFALTFAISWGGALMAIDGSGGMRGTTPTSDPRFVYALLAMLVGPSATGILLTGLIDRRVGLRAFVSRLLAWRVNARWYAIALFTAPVATAVGVFVGYLTAFRVLMVWVYDRTESLFVAMLMHVSLTASLLILNPLGISGAHLMAYSFALAVALWIVVAALAVANRKEISRQPLRRQAA